MKKVLFSATVLKGHILKFHLPYLKWFQSQGYHVTVVAANDTDDPHVKVPYCDEYIDIPFKRNPLSFSNIKAYRQLKQLICSNAFDIISCHTPVGGVLTRLAASKSKSKVMYTAHGFHFYKGASLLNWLIYYPLEKYFSSYCDALVTINQEDYQLAQKMRAPKVYLVHGVGVDFSERKTDQCLNRETLQIPENAFMIVSIGELNRNKNHQLVLEALKNMKCDTPVVYVIAGEGKLADTYQAFAQQHHIDLRLIGFQKDIMGLLKSCDCFAFPSIREGLPVSLMEAMKMGKVAVVTPIRGNIDLIDNQEGGFYASEALDFQKAFETFMAYPDVAIQMGEYNQHKVVQYEIENVLKEYIQIYESLMKEKEEVC